MKLLQKVSTNVQRYKAFTLAEVLITLGIIGVVAAMTIPTLMNNSTKKETVVRVKKAYSILSQATEQINMDCGGSVLYCLTNPAAADNDATAREEIAKLYKAKLSIVRDCTDGATSSCFANTTYKFLSGGDYANIDTVSFLNKSRMVLSDGTAVAFDWNLGGNYNVFLDVNSEKMPNQWGKDLFVFPYDSTTNTFKPVTIDDCNTSNEGFGCAAVILQTDKIDYY